MLTDLIKRCSKLLVSHPITTINPHAISFMDMYRAPEFVKILVSKIEENINV